jgi:hypothetical protein
LGVKDWDRTDVLPWSKVFIRGRGRVKDDLNQRAEIEVFISFLGYQTELWGVVLTEIKNQKICKFSFTHDINILNSIYA